MSIGYQKPKVDWVGADRVRDTDLNRTEGNVAIALYSAEDRTDFLPDGSIKTTWLDGTYAMTTFEADGSIVETRYTSLNVIIDAFATLFDADGAIRTVRLV